MADERATEFVTLTDWERGVVFDARPAAMTPDQQRRLYAAVERVVAARLRRCDRCPFAGAECNLDCPSSQRAVEPPTVIAPEPHFFEPDFRPEKCLRCGYPKVDICHVDSWTTVTNPPASSALGGDDE